MAFEGDMARFLAASTRVQQHLGGSPGSRIQMSQLPQDVTYPAIRYQRISTVPLHTQDGPTGKPTVRMQIDNYGRNAGDAVSLAGSVRKAMDGFVGQMNGTATVSLRDDEDTLYESEADVFRVRQDYMITYAEATT